MRPPTQTIKCLAFFFLLLSLCILAGCFGRTKPPYVIDQYTLDYPSPGGDSSLKPLGELIRVERFSVAPGFNSTSMAIKSGQYRYDAYDYSRWRVNPGDMVTGFMLRDITRSGIFKGTYCYYDSDLSRYILDGYIDEFGETSDGKAMIGVRITLIDTNQKNPVEQIVFQKRYDQSSPMGERSPEALAAGLSDAMKQISGRIITDMRAAFNDQQKIR
ncbi:MAG: ABC-type transport auxiliary lipoprotein family protein [Syntrophorhabdaceae bacterium]